MSNRHKNRMEGRKKPAEGKPDLYAGPMSSLRASATIAMHRVMVEPRDTGMSMSSSGSHTTLRWREMDSNFRFLVARPSNRHGRRDYCLCGGDRKASCEPGGRVHPPVCRATTRHRVVDCRRNRIRPRLSDPPALRTQPILPLIPQTRRSGDPE
jgi:hypothetical protein